MEFALQSQRQILVGSAPGRVVPGQQEAQGIGELLDGVPDLLEPFLAQRVLFGSCSCTSRAAESRKSSNHDATGWGAAAIASASSRYAAFNGADTVSTGTPCIPA